MTVVGGDGVRGSLDRILDQAADHQRPLTSIVLGRRAVRRLQRELAADEAPRQYRGLPIRVRADYATYVGAEGPLTSVRPDCACAACRAGVLHEATCPVHQGTCRRCRLPVQQPSDACAAHAGACICGRPVPIRRTPT